MAKFHRSRFAAVFTADADLEIRTGLASEFHANLHQFANASLVNRGKRILLVDLALDIFRQESACIVPGDPQGCLCKIVGAKAEEFSRFGDFVCRQRGTRNLDHRTDQIIHLNAGFFDDSFRHFARLFFLQAQLFGVAHQRNHDLGVRIAALFLHFAGSFHDGPHLHPGDLRIGDAETTAAMTKHRVHLVERIHVCADLLFRHIQLLGKICDLFVGMRQEFVKRRIKRPDSDRAGLHGFENALEVIPLHRQQFLQRFLTTFGVIGEDHLAYCVDPIAAEEHVFGPRQADAFRAECHSGIRLIRLVSVSTDTQFTDIIGPLHKLVEYMEIFGLFRLHGSVNQHLYHFGGLRFQFAFDHVTDRSID
ncbi:MAG: hypothetical protein MAGBODY4_00993 [Candidatus Marinimicrobia bacterium]|nr:hypothetical protein [Candidatus Neomarinimicrobiota bacterium]